MSSVSPSNSVGRNYIVLRIICQQLLLNSNPGSVHLVAKPSVAATGVLFASRRTVGRAHNETHVPVEACCAEQPELVCCACGPARRVIIISRSGQRRCWCAADVGIAVGVVLDGLGHVDTVEREDGEGRAGGLLRALHLQDNLRAVFLCLCWVCHVRPTNVASDSA